MKSLKDQITNLTKERNNLKNIVIKFIKGKENLNIMLNQQKCGLNKEGLGYIGESSKSKVNSLYHVKSKETNNATPFTKCSYCNRNGHSIYMCNVRNCNYKGKMICVPKGTFIEPHAQHIQKRNVYKPQRINYKESSKMVYSRFSHSYRHNINNDYYRPNNHKNKILVNTKSDYPLPKFISQGTNISYHRLHTYPKDPSY